jgi:hypothetical protein
MTTDDEVREDELDYYEEMALAQYPHMDDEFELTHERSRERRGV